MRKGTLQIAVIICLVALARQQPCADILKYNRSTDGDICLINNVTVLCRWKQEQDGRRSWEEKNLGGERFLYVPMSGMSETDEPVQLLSSELCSVPSVIYNFSFQYHLGNRSNCELTVQMKKSAQYVLWNSSRTSDHGARQNVSLSNATCDCKYQIVFEVRKYNRESCGSPAWDNFIAIRDIGYTPLPTTTALSPPQPSTATTKTNTTTTTATTAPKKTTPQGTVDPGTSSVIPFDRTASSSKQSQTGANPTSAATSPGRSTESSVSTNAALINDTITPGGMRVIKDGTLNVGATVGVVLGVLAAVIVVSIFVVFIRQRKMNNNKSCAWMSKSMNPKPGGTARAATNSAYTDGSGNNGPTASSFSTPASQPVYELADATHLQEYANLQYPPLVDQMGYQIPFQTQSSRRYQESGLEESVLDESNYDTTEDAQTGNYYSVPHVAISDNSHITTTNPVAATTTPIRQPKADNVYELADEPNMGRNRVLPEDSYNRLSYPNPLSKAPVPEGTRPYDHIGDVVRNKTATDSSEYSLANAGDNAYRFASHQHPSSRGAGVAHILADAGTPVNIRTNAGTLSHNPASMNTHSDIFAFGETTADILAMAGTPVLSGRMSASPCQDDSLEDSDPCYSQIGEALANTRSVPAEGNEYSLAKTYSNAESNVLSSTCVEANCGVDYSLGRAQDNVESIMSSPQPQQNTWSEYSLAGAHVNTDIVATSATQAHVDYYNTVDFNTRANAGPLEECNALNFDSSESKGGDKRDQNK